jgi:nucleotide-binding universal stress UspA family protein
MRLKHILVPTDFSEGSDRAGAVAAELASRFGAKITLLHAWPVPTPMPVAGVMSWPADRIVGPATAALAREQAALTDRHVETEVMLLAGDAVDRIVEAAKEHDVDLVVMATHGRRGLPRFLLGSVAEKIVRSSPVPVLTVPFDDDFAKRGPLETRE